MQAEVFAKATLCTKRRDKFWPHPCIQSPLFSQTLEDQMSVRQLTFPGTFACFLIGLLAAAHGDDVTWPNWRGPTSDGQATSDADPPVTWSENTGIVWTTNLPGEGSATPVVWQDKVFVLSAEETSKSSEQPASKANDARTEPPAHYYRFLVSCIDRRSGQVHWQKTATEQVPHEGRHPTHTYAAGSPVTDGQRLYASFSSRGLYCYTLDGDLIWQVDLGDMKTRFGWGEAVTPALAGNTLIVNWDQEEGSFITALSTETGDELWRKDRPGEATSWNTPLITHFDGRTIAVVNGSGKTRAYDVANGDVLWECGGQTINAIPSPVRFEDSVICMSGYRGAMCVAIPLNATGDITGTSQVRWSLQSGTPYVPSPLLSQKRLYFTAGNNDLLTVVDAKTGKLLVEKKRLGIGDVYASPVAAGGHVFLLGRHGIAAVVKDDGSGEVVNLNRLNETFDASPVAVGRQLLLRGHSKLYCIEDLTTARDAAR
jgi:outer membrane protein assembly factor BamB